MSTIVHIPKELAERLAAEAAKRVLSVDELTADLLATGLSIADPPK